MKKPEHLTPVSVSNSLSWGYATLKNYFLHLLLIVFVLAIVDTPANNFRQELGEIDSGRIIIQIIGIAYIFLFLPIIGYSADLIFIQAVRNERPEVRNIIIGFKNYLNIVLANVMVTSLVGISLIALIVPGIIVACRLVFVSYLVMDKNLDPIEAIEASWKMTKGYAWQIFVLGITSIFIFILGLLALIVGILPAIMWIKSSFASLYQGILIENTEEN